MIDINQMIISLEELCNNLGTDMYNDNTVNWSRGYKKGFQDVIEIIKKLTNSN